MKKITKTVVFLLLCKIGNSQIINTIAGGAPPPNGLAATSALLSGPQGITVASNGSLYFSESGNSLIRKVSTTGFLTTAAGNGSFGSSGDGGFAIAASLSNPVDVAIDNFGNFYISDYSTNTIRKVNASGVISTIAGNGTSGYSGNGGPAINAQLNGPDHMALDASGNLYFADGSNNVIRKVSTGGLITTVVGNAISGFTGDGGLATSARINSPKGIAIASDGTLYFLDGGNARVRKVSPAGIITTIAGNGAFGYTGDGGSALSAKLDGPDGLCVDNANNVYIIDYNNNVIRKISAGIITTIAGTGVQGFSGDGGLAVNAKLNWPSDLAADNNGNIYFSDFTNNRIRKINSSGIISTVAGTAPPNNVLATATQLNQPHSTAIGKNGKIFISEREGLLIRCLNPNGVIYNYAGTGSFGYSGDNGPAINAELGYVFDMAVDTAGNLVFCDMAHSVIRKILSDGTIITIAGTTTSGYSGDGGLAVNARIDGPYGIGTDKKGNIYFTDQYNTVIRKINANGIISTVAGNGVDDYLGDGGLAMSAAIGSVMDVAVDTSGSIFLSQPNYNVIRKVDPAGIITTYAGTGNAAYSGDGGLAINAEFNGLEELAVTDDGTLFIQDAYNSAIRMITPSGIISTFAGNGIQGFSGDGGASYNAKISYPWGVATDGTGTTVVVTDNGNNRIRKISTLPIPEICMVTVDSLSLNNEIYWDKTNYFNIDSFVIYRETNSNPSTYSIIASVSYDSLSVFRDTLRSPFLVNGDPNISTYRYKIQLLDRGGNYSFLSNYHNSIYVSNTGSDFSWNTYEIENTGSPFSYYQLLRDNFATGSWSVVGTTSASQTQLNDPNYATYQSTANWSVIAVGPVCNPTMRLVNGGKESDVFGTIVKSKSNIKTNRTANPNAISEINNPKSAIKVYPNPANGIINVELLTKSEEATVSLENILGQIVYSAKMNKGAQSMDASNFETGIYLVKVKTEKGLSVQKVVVE